MSKAQAFTVDILFAFTIFIIVLVFFIQIQDNVTQKGFETNTQFEHAIRFEKATNLLFMGPPASEFSLIDPSRTFIQIDKLDYLFEELESNYTNVKKELGLADLELYVQTYILSETSYELYNQSGNFSVSDIVYQKEYLFVTQNTSSIKFIVGVFT